MGRFCAAIVVVGVIGVAHADAPVKIASVPDGPIKLGVGEDDGELKRAFRLVPQGVEQVKIDHVRVVECTDARGQSCPVRVEPGGCAGGCALTATEPGSVTVVVTLAKPGVYTSSLEIVYIKEEKQLPDNKLQVVKAVLATTLEVTRPAAAVQPMKVTVTGPNGADVDLVPSRHGTANLRLRLQDDDGAARKLAQVARTPLVRKSGNDSLACDAGVAMLVGETRVPLADGAPLELPTAGSALEVEVSNLDEPGKYEGKLRLLAPGRTPQEIAYTVTVRDGVWWAGIMIAIGALLSYGVQWWVGRRRARLVQQKALERLRVRLQDLQGRDGLADRDRRLIDALADELDDKLYTVEDGTALAADVLERFARRVALADVLIKTGQDVEQLPLAARGEPRKQLDANAILLADRSVDDPKLKDIESALRTIASTGVRRAALLDLLARFDAAVKQAQGALSAGLQRRLRDEVGPSWQAAHAAADSDRLADLARALDQGRGALARVQGAALAERLPETPPTAFDDPAAYQALRDEVTAKLNALDAASDADTAVRLYDEALARVATATYAAVASWCRGQTKNKPEEIQRQLRALATEAEAARDKPPGEALAILDRVMGEAEALARGPEGRPTGTNDAEEPQALAAIPRLASLARRARIRTGTVLAIGDGAVLVAVTLVAVATGLKLLWAGNPTWGGWNDWLTAMLWGAGLHAVGNESFKGLLGLQKGLGKVE